MYVVYVYSVRIKKTHNLYSTKSISVGRYVVQPAFAAQFLMGSSNEARKMKEIQLWETKVTTPGCFVHP